MSAREPGTSAAYLSAGPAAAIALGIALIPLRGRTPASNFAFAFIVLIIVVAEYGGRGAALATALVSALSLNFFLTTPYLRLTIHSPHDIVAFVGLAVCGLTAAALGARRGERLAELEAVRRHRDFLRAALGSMDPAGSAEAQLTVLLRGAREAVPLEALVIRDARGEAIASSAPADAERPVPDARIPLGAPALTETGGRIELRSERRILGALDVWGTPAAVDAEGARMMSDVARMAALVLAGAGTPRVEAGGGRR